MRFHSAYLDVPSPRRRALPALRALLTLALLAGLVSGCAIYIDDDGGSGPDGGVCATPPIAPLRLLDPSTGTCVDFNQGPICDPVTCECEPGPAQPYPSWASCDSYCSGRDELSCMYEPGCRALYHDGQFSACHATDQTGPVQGSCEGLDAWSCSRHDDCTAHYETYYAAAESPPWNPTPSFLSCEPEPAICYGDDECGENQHCSAEYQCLIPGDCQDDPACDAVCAGFCVPDEVPACFGEVLCESLPPACPEGTTPETADGCWTGDCVPLDECPPVPYEQCYGEPVCDALPPACPNDHQPQLRGGCWTGACIPDALCEAPAPVGACFGAIECDIDAAPCPNGMVRGIADGCWTDTCIPLDQCGSWPPNLYCGVGQSCDVNLPDDVCPADYYPLITGSDECWNGMCAPAGMCGMPPLACEDVQDEETCLEHAGCAPVYVGDDCICGPEGCSCERYTYAYCN
ncbi:hypothetical protein [Haliangium ochraceum]|uniref:Uncharacterized protein n=1 Tax=Haliangium ochraceum (strain DSM 14365 / JCM 11303 / SMP-2) TaxID=502025 RepID=D0LX18_HALO1|nr:hypothetical protein [Haliangium ochraceum]ACY14265.1 hypothetical protein Hoch_1716 [Haliangium ochraceum DSM 14365]